MDKKPREGNAAGVVLWFVAVLSMGSLVMIAGCAREETTDPIAHGRVSYETYCMSCHGEKGTGNGEIAMAGDLAILPSNLTQLSSQNGGVFPVDGVYQTIDGRNEVEAHGTRQMPVWGNIWSDDEGTPVREEIVQRRINELVEYLRSIQE